MKRGTGGRSLFSATRGTGKVSVRRVFFIYLLQSIVYEIDFSKVNNFKEKKYAKKKKNVLIY